MLSTACLKSYLSDTILTGDLDAAENILVDWQNTFGDDVFIEIMPNDSNEQRMLNVHLVNLGNKLGIPVQATCDVHYPYKDWFDTYRTAGLMATKNTFAGIEKKKAEGKKVLDFDLPTLYLMDDNEVREAFAENHADLDSAIVEKAIQNTHVLADRVTPFFIDRRLKMPNVKKKIPDPEAKVMEWIEEGLERIEKTDDSIYQERLAFELEELRRKAVFDYFYIVGEAVRWAKSNKIRVGLGRGSAAGCLVSYLVGITDIDPIAYNLLFERFLNPNRKGMPDIDIDFDSEGRQRVKEHLGELWGKDHVADIIAHSTFKPKAVLQDVARVYDIPYKEVHDVTDTIDIRPDDEETTLLQLQKINPILDDYAKKYPEPWRDSLRLEGTTKNASKHAAGMVITDQAVKEYMPLELSKDGGFVTAFNDSAEFPVITEYLNVMKLDFLGIKGLSKQSYAIEIIEQQSGEYLNLSDLPILRDPEAVDPEVMANFAKGLTIGVFQFNKEGITGFLKSIRPDTILDLVAANALYRPGPMEYAFEYGSRKKMPADELDYWHPKIKPYLLETFGLVAYQEQLMQIVQAVGGFTPGDADDMRKAMGKLYRLPGQQAQQFMQGYYSKWEEGCKAHDISQQKCDEIWQFFLSFGNYAFNKSHSAAYAVQAYQDMYIKTYYPLAYYAALFTKDKKQKAEEDNRFKAAGMREARMFNVKILPPDINTSGMGFTVDGSSLRYGLLKVSQVGDVAANAIIANRPYESYDDFCAKVKPREVNKKAKEALVDCGGFDSFEARAHLTEKEKAELEKRTLGIPLSTGQLLERHKDELDETIYSKEEFDDAPSVHELSRQEKEKSSVILAGEITSVKPIKTKNGDNMAFFNLSYGVDEYSCVLFPAPYSKYKGYLSAGSVLIRGYKDAGREPPSIQVTKMIDIASVAEEWENAQA